MLKKFFLDRLREPSTYAGVGILGAAVGLPAELIAPAGQIIMGLGGVLAILLRDKGPTP